jgi:hypothetical protein
MKSWKRKIKSDKYQLYFNSNKRQFLKQLNPIGDVQGGAYYDPEGRLRYRPTMAKQDYENLFTDRGSRLVRAQDESGNSMVIGLSEIPSVEEGKFYNTVSKPSLKVSKRNIRDWLLEPSATQVDLFVYKTDLELRSKPRISKISQNEQKDATPKAKTPMDAVLKEAIQEGFAGEPLREVEQKEKLSSQEKLVAKAEKLGNRKAIAAFTLASRNKLKFTARNALCVWTTMVTLTYPKDFPRNGRTCKRHLNTWLTHLRQDYPGVKYLWFMEFQERGAPHFHIFLTCPIPGFGYVNPLWYHIIGTDDKQHLNSGTQVKRITTESEAIAYATSYAGKATQKAVPSDFEGVGRFWGCSRGLLDWAACLEDLSVYELQHIRGEYLASMKVSGREDRMNCYLWNGSEWAGQIFTDYYNLHLRPLIAESIDVVGIPSLKNPVRPTTSMSPQEFLGFLRYVKKRKINKEEKLPDAKARLNLKSLYSFFGEKTEFVRKPRVVNLLKEALRDRAYLKYRPLKDLSESIFNEKMSSEAKGSESLSGEIAYSQKREEGVFISKFYKEFWLSSLAEAYYAGSASHISQEAFEFSEIAAKDMHAWIISCMERLREAWHKKHKPRYNSVEHVLISLVHKCQLIKRRFIPKVARNAPIDLNASGMPK